MIPSANSDDFEEEEDLFDDFSDDTAIPPTQEAIFSIEDLKNAKELRTVQVAPWLTNIYIPSLSMTHAYRMAILGWVNTHLTVDELLSDHSVRPSKGLALRMYDPYEYAKEQAILALKKTWLSASKKDTRQSWWGTLDDNLMYAYNVVHSRTWGPHRERVLQIKKITSTEQSVKNETGSQESQKKKKNWIFG